MNEQQLTLLLSLIPARHRLFFGCSQQPGCGSARRSRRRDSEWPGDEDLVFTDTAGGYLHVGNLRRRVLKPARQEADLGWVGFHTLRHTCASMLFAQGRDAVQVQRWLGHHSAAFTLSRYVHLLDGDLGAPLTLPSPRRPAPVAQAA